MAIKIRKGLVCIYICTVFMYQNEEKYIKTSLFLFNHCKLVNYHEIQTAYYIYFFWLKIFKHFRTEFMTTLHIS